MFCLDPGYILRPGYRGHWSLVDITYYMSLCNIIIYYKTVCNIFLHYIHIIFSVWLIFLVYTFENTNALEHIFICVLVGVLCFGLIRSISKTSFNPPKEIVDTGSRRCPQCSQNFLI